MTDWANSASAPSKSDRPKRIKLPTMKNKTGRLPHWTTPKILLALLLITTGAQADTSIWPSIKKTIPLDPAVESGINDWLGQMSTEQKVGQMIMAEIKHISPHDVGKFHIGGILNGGGSWPTSDPLEPLGAWLKLANLFYDASMENSAGKLPIPVIWGTDAVHGHNNVAGATLFPHNIGLGAANNPTLMRDIGIATAREVAVTGIDWVFAPTVAVAKDVRWGRSYESYAEDPKIVATLSKELILGLQGHPALDNFLSEEKMVATAKHFVGDGGTSMGSGKEGKGLDQGNTVVTEEDLFRIHGRGYVQAIGVGVQTVMASFSSWNGDKMHGHSYLLTEILKGRMGFDGFVVGDWNGHEQVPGCNSQSCPTAIMAGVDMIMVPENWRLFLDNTIRQVESGMISMERIDDAVRRILRVKYRAGMFEHGRPVEHMIAAKASLIGHPQHRAVARQAVRESLVLLKNEGILPLKAKRLLLTGSGADSAAMQTGGWTVTWQGRDNKTETYQGTTTLLKAFKEAYAGRGGEVIQSLDGSLKEAPDAAILVFGETPYAEFEGDIESLAFGGEQNTDFKLMKKLQAQGIPVIGLFLTGRPRELDAMIDMADAFVVAWLPGSEGAGVSDVLLADGSGQAVYDFTGRLPFAWPQANSAEPRYPRGFGLSYQTAQ